MTIRMMTRCVHLMYALLFEMLNDMIRATHLPRIYYNMKYRSSLIYAHINTTNNENYLNVMKRFIFKNIVT